MNDKKKSAEPAKIEAVRSGSQDSLGLSDLFEHGLKDIYYAERKIYKSLPKMIRAARDQKLVEGLTAHRDETAEHIDRLEQCFEFLGKRARAEKCDAIDGILDECEGLLENFGDSAASDAAIIFAQSVEHYEITRYGSLVTYAKELGMNECAKLLSATLDEEEKADTKLSAIATRSANTAATAAKSAA